MDEQSERARLDEQVKKIFYEELEKSGIRYDFAQVRVSDTRTVGVQGDGRT
jgi:GMP synthase PP-ATPase subunit